MAASKNRNFNTFGNKPSKSVDSEDSNNIDNKFKTYRFNWKGILADGTKTKGIIIATSLAVAKAELAKQKVKVQRITKESAIWAALNKKPIKFRDITALTRQLATMTTAGIPIIQCFDILMRGITNNSLNEMLYAIKNDVTAGTKLSDALAKYPKHFDQLYCSLIEAGEEAGALGKMLERLAIYMEKSESIKRKIKKALFYPAIIVLVGIVVSVILLVKVIPEFQGIFANFNAELPSFTLFVIGLSNWMQENVVLFVGGIIAAIVLFVFLYRKNKSFHKLIDQISLKLPVLGMIITKGILARFARTLATTFSSGMSLIAALKIVTSVPDNVIYESAIRKARNSVIEGRSLYASLESSNLFPNIMLQMISIGEETGELDKMLNKTAKVYEEEVDAAVDALSSLIEPVIMIVLGVIVGGLVIAMYLPIFKLGSVV